MQDIEHDGLCLGGPINGKRIKSSADYVVVPVQIPGEPGWGQANYTWHDIAGAWIYGYGRRREAA